MIRAASTTEALVELLEQRGPMTPDEIARAVLPAELVFAQLSDPLRFDLAMHVVEATMHYLENTDDRAAFVVAVRRLREQIDQARWRIDWWSLPPAVRQTAVHHAHDLVKSAIGAGRAERVRWDNQWVIKSAG